MQSFQFFAQVIHFHTLDDVVCDLWKEEESSETPDAPICYAVGSGCLEPCKIAFQKSLSRSQHEIVVITSLNRLPLKRKGHLLLQHVRHGTDQETGMAG